LIMSSNNRPGTTRVAIVVPWAARLGGAEQMLWGILSNLDRGSVDALVIFLEDGPFRDEVAELGYDTATLRATHLRDLPNFIAVVWKLSKLLRGDRPDVVLSWMAKAHLYAAPAAIFSGLARRCAWWQHLIPERHWMDRIATTLPANAIGASSSRSAKAQRRMRPRRKTFVVTPGVDIERYRPNGDNGRAVRDDCGFSSTAFVVTIVGRLQPWKGQQLVLQAIAQLRDDGVDAAAIIVGGEAFGESEGFERELRTLAEEIGIGRFVRFTGHVADPAPYLHASDVCVNASDEEPFGIVLLEAMAAGLPVVAVDRGGPAEIINSGTTGLLIPHATTHALAGALKTLADDPALARRLGAAAQNAAMQSFSVERMADAFATEMRRLGTETGPSTPAEPRGPEREVTIIVQHIGPRGGMERQVTELITGYLAAGWLVTIIARECDIAPDPNLNWVPVRGPYRPFAIGYPWFFLRASLLLTRHRRGIVHVNGALVGNRADLATIHFSHRGFRRTASERGGSRATLLHQLNSAASGAEALLAERWCYRSRRIPRLVAISDGVGRETAREYGYDTDRVRVIPYGVDTALFARDEPARRRARDELNASDTDLLVLFVGGDWGRKGLATLIDALPDAEGWRLVVVGPGDERAYGRQAAERGVDGRVTFLGSRTLPTDLYSAADAFCLPTAYETFCLVAHEAAAASLPLLVTHVHGVDVLLEDGVNGWFVRREPEDIARRLRALGDDPELRARMGAAARTASLRYAWSLAVDDHLELYEEIRQQRATAPPS
jgi:glycosyltransferase involved in cell wall biosynthesis